MSDQKAEIKLTQWSHGSGCGCKIAPATLEKILKDKFSFPDKKLLVGNSSKDDAAVYDLGNGTALISTTDFFMPVVNDPYDFGRIASANAISDIYAMGGTPALAIAILGFPVDKLDAEVAAKIIEGSRAVCKEAGITLAGGHSIDNPEPIFGLSVNGFVSVPNLKKNNTAQPGDLLFLTKALGIGILSSAIKKNVIEKEDAAAVVDVMCSLNKVGEELGKLPGVHALTDVTGFGLLGHLIEMSEGSGTSAEIEYKNVPLLPGLDKYISKSVFPDNVFRNWSSFEKKVKGINGPEFITLSDPQTNGGLLIALDPGAQGDYLNIARKANLSESALKPIGRITDKMDFVVSVS